KASGLPAGRRSAWFVLACDMPGPIGWEIWCRAGVEAQPPARLARANAQVKKKTRRGNSAKQGGHPVRRSVFNLLFTGPFLPRPPRDRLFLPGAFLMAIGAQLLAALMLVNLCFATF